MTNNFSPKEQRLLDMINRVIETEPHWAENIYEDDDDPHSEMLIKYIMMGVDQSFSLYLNHVITKAPEHKLNVLGAYLLSGVMLCYLTDNNHDYIDTLLKRFPELLKNDNFWKGFCQKVQTNENFLALFQMEQHFDPNLTKCKQACKLEEQSIFIKYDLFKKLNGKLPEKNTIIKNTKI